jgi:hypothetical protein
MRNVEWVPELKFEYDSSFPDTDPYEPQPGGCCSIWPYFISNLLELPMTMPQDHTLFEILQHKDISVWKIKADWIEAKGGMVLINVHPDTLEHLHRLPAEKAVLDAIDFGKEALAQEVFDLIGVANDLAFLK